MIRLLKQYGKDLALYDETGEIPKAMFAGGSEAADKHATVLYIANFQPLDLDGEAAGRRASRKHDRGLHQPCKGGRKMWQQYSAVE